MRRDEVPGSGVQTYDVVATSLERPRTLTFDEDLVLVDRFMAGDESAFQTLYARYYDKVFGIARGILLDVDEAADAVQEVFSLVVRNLPKFDRRSRFSTWLFRIAVNRSIQEARKHRHRYKNVPLDEAAERVETHDPEPPDPRVQATLAKMTPGDRALLVLFYWEEAGLQEIADSVGCNLNAAKTRLYRARERFRALYEQEAP
jgi:RNA polymerase sigma-70 factor (ECF subfamily)